MVGDSNGALERFDAVLLRPDLVRAAARGELLEAPDLASLL